MEYTELVYTVLYLYVLSNWAKMVKLMCLMPSEMLNTIALTLLTR